MTIAKIKEIFSDIMTGLRLNIKIEDEESDVDAIKAGIVDLHHRLDKIRLKIEMANESANQINKMIEEYEAKIEAVEADVD